LIDEQVLEDLRVEFRPKSYEVEVALGVVVQADIATERFTDVDVTEGTGKIEARAEREGVLELEEVMVG